MLSFAVIEIFILLFLIGFFRSKLLINHLKFIIYLFNLFAFFQFKRFVIAKNIHLNILLLILLTIKYIRSVNLLI